MATEEDMDEEIMGLSAGTNKARSTGGEEAEGLVELGAEEREEER